MAECSPSSDGDIAETEMDEEEMGYEEKLLYAARNGDAKTVRMLLDQNHKGKIALNINCKGKSKANLGWSPLHLASYFGHEEVATTLLMYAADVNLVTPRGDTPLHRAAYTGRLNLVALLIQYSADVTIVNGEGSRPKDVAIGKDVVEMIEATEQAQQLKGEQSLLHAATEGNTLAIKSLLNGARPPNINCTDTTGNTPMHCVSYRDHCDAAVVLLQHGADTKIKNSKGFIPLDVAQSPQMRQLLDIKPVKVVHKTADRFEGALLKPSRFTKAWKRYWVVLERGVLTIYRRRADAVTGVKRQGFKYLDHAELKTCVDDATTFLVHYSDNTSHIWKTDHAEKTQTNREQWLESLKSHRAYSEHYTTADPVDDDVEEDLMSMGSIQNALKTAEARHTLLEQQVLALQTILASQIQKGASNPKAAVELAEMVPTLNVQLQQILDTSKETSASLAQGLAVMTKQEELRKLQLEQAVEKTRVLEDALQSLARSHHRLERVSRSLNPSPVYFDVNSDDEGGFPVTNEANDISDDCLSISSTESFHSTMDTQIVDGFSDMHVSETETSGQSSNHVASDKHGTTTTEEETVEGEKNGKQVIQRSKSAEFIIPGCHRSKLPAPMLRRDQFSLWTVLKQCIGKELSKITMPVVFNEPMSFLQRMSEYIEHAQLLIKADSSEDPVDRMKYVAAFVLSAGASNLDRLSKPFNPLLGETYELIREDLDLKMVLEQVSHHPPVSAFHCHCPSFEFHGSIYPKLKFWGKSLEIAPKGLLTIKLNKHNESYTWNNPASCVHNLIVGRLWIEMYGLVEIVNHKTGHKCTLDMKQAGWFGKDIHKVDGHISDRKGNKKAKLFGKWVEYLYSMEPDQFELARSAEKQNQRTSRVPSSPKPEKGSLPRGYHPTYIWAKVPPHLEEDWSINPDGPEFQNAELLWRNVQRPDNSLQYYNFTLFAMRVNELSESMKKHMAPTDSRLRPDIRHLENGDVDSASDEKHRLEEKQRAVRKQRHKLKETWLPVWFRQGTHPLTGDKDVWLYKGEYWDRSYSHCPDIF